MTKTIQGRIAGQEIIPYNGGRIVLTPEYSFKNSQNEMVKVDTCIEIQEGKKVSKIISRNALQALQSDDTRLRKFIADVLPEYAYDG